MALTRGVATSSYQGSHNGSGYELIRLSQGEWLRTHTKALTRGVATSSYQGSHKGSGYELIPRLSQGEWLRAHTKALTMGVATSLAACLTPRLSQWEWLRAWLALHHDSHKGSGYEQGSHNGRGYEPSLPCTKALTRGGATSLLAACLNKGNSCTRQPTLSSFSLMTLFPQTLETYFGHLSRQFFRSSVKTHTTHTHSTAEASKRTLLL